MQDDERRRQQMQPPDPPVARVRATLDHAASFQPIDQACHGDRLNLENFRKLFLRDARLPLQPDQDAPLRPCHTVLPGTLVRIDAEQTGDIVQQEEQVATTLVKWHFPYSPLS